jgi:multiple sugar transport system permease protein
MAISARRIGDFWNKPEHAAYIFLLPALTLLFVFNVVPLLASFLVSTLDVTVYLTGAKFVGLRNFIEAVRDPRFWNALANTLVFTAVEVPLQICFALLVAALVTRDTRINKVYRSIYFLPIVCSATAVGIMWQFILNQNIGYIPYALTKLGLPRIAFLKDPSIALFTIVFISVWRTFGITTTIFVAAMQDVPTELYESSEIDGAGKLRQFFRITIPGIMPSIWFILITRVIGSLQVFDLVYVTTGGGPVFKTETLVTYIYSRAFTTNIRLGYATAMSECLFLIILLISICLYSRMVKQERE